MNTAYNLIWSEKGVDDIVGYLERKWTRKEVRRFLVELRERVRLIAKQPELFRLVEETDYTCFSVLNNRSTIYYDFRNNRIEILYVFNTRQNPGKLSFKN